MLTGWWKLTLEHSLDPGDQTNESFFQETIMSHRNKLMKPLEIAKECLLVYPSLYGLQWPWDFGFENQKQGQGWKFFSHWLTLQILIWWVFLCRWIISLRQVTSEGLSCLFIYLYGYINLASFWHWGCLKNFKDTKIKWI